MRILLLRSDVAADAPADEQDTLVTARAVANALSARGHEVTEEAFVPDPEWLDRVLTNSAADVVFNIVESVFGQGSLAGLAPAFLERRGIPFTGASAIAIGCCADKPLTKRLLRASQLSTADWSEPPVWCDLNDDRLYVVKSATEDCSLGLDESSVVRGHAARARASLSAKRFGGSWFAEAYCPGREFNVSLIETEDGPCVLPIGEIMFSDWHPDRPRLVGYAAKWDSRSPEYADTPRVFGVEAEHEQLARNLTQLSLAAWRLFGLKGYARVDVRLDADGAPMILEINPNPCLEPQAGFAAAALMDGISYAELIDRILQAPLNRSCIHLTQPAST